MFQTCADAVVLSASFLMSCREVRTVPRLQTRLCAGQHTICASSLASLGLYFVSRWPLMVVTALCFFDIWRERAVLACVLRLVEDVSLNLTFLCGTGLASESAMVLFVVSRGAVWELTVEVLDECVGGVNR